MLLSPATKSSAGISLVAVPFSSKSTSYSLPLTLMVTVPVALGTFTVTLPFVPIHAGSAVTVMFAKGLMIGISTTASVEVAIMASSVASIV